MWAAIVGPKNGFMYGLKSMHTPVLNRTPVPTRGKLVSAAISPYFSLIHYWPMGSYRIKSPACPDMRENFFGWVFSD